MLWTPTIILPHILLFLLQSPEIIDSSVNDKLKDQKKSRDLQQHLRWPSTPQMKDIILKNIFVNFPVTIGDIICAEAIYGAAITILKLKSIRKCAEHHAHIPCIPLPAMIMDHHSSVNIFMDFLFVNRTPYYHTRSEKINFLPIQACKGCGKK